MTLSGKIRRGPERKVLIAFTFRVQNEGWDDKIKGFFFFFKQRKKTRLKCKFFRETEE